MKRWSVRECWKASAGDDVRYQVLLEEHGHLGRPVESDPSPITESDIRPGSEAGRG